MPVLGVIADDVTGGSDVAAALRRAGLSVTLAFGVPTGDPAPGTSDAVVVALKTRTVPVAEAVQQSLAALDRLLEHGVERVYFKYCSTFDSTSEGNIGPVTDALLQRLGERQTLVCPATPEHGRTVYQGHLFVGSDLLSESSMREHPLTPMRDSRLASLLAPQTDGAVEVLDLVTVRSGRSAVSDRLLRLEERGVRHVVVDAVEDADLDVVADASGHLRLLTGGAGLAGALGRRLGTRQDDGPAALPEGPALVLAGSCSAATLRQVARAVATFPSYRLDPARTPDPGTLLSEARAWLAERWGQHEALLVYSSADAEDRARGREAMGERTAEVLERSLGVLARDGVDRGAVRVVVAGGESSGAVVDALGVARVTVAGEEDRGVPWCLVPGERPLALLLKSGNFGADDLLVRAVRTRSSAGAR